MYTRYNYTNLIRKRSSNLRTIIIDIESYSYFVTINKSFYYFDLKINIRTRYFKNIEIIVKGKYFYESKTTNHYFNNGIY